MTSRAAALAGLQYFADIRTIARQVDVAVPSDAAIAERFARTDSIDVQALTADSAMLAGIVTSVTGASDSASDAHAALPDAWRGRAADAAGAAVAAHVQAAQDATERIRTVSNTVAAAALALTRVQAEKHRTLSMLRTDHVAGQPIATISADDVELHADAVRTDIAAAVDLFTRTMDVVDTAVSAILTALTDSFAALPAPVPADPGHPSPARPSAPSDQGQGQGRESGGSRADIVASAGGSSERVVSGLDSTVAVAAISAGATITGAALAAASTVGSAAIDGLGSVLNHLIDAAPGDEGHDPEDGRRSHPGVESHSETTRSAPVGQDRADDVPAAPTRDRGDTAPEPSSPRRLEPTLSEPDEPDGPSVPAAPRASEVPDRDPPENDRGDPAPSEPRSSAPTAGDVDARGVPSSGPRVRDSPTPRGRPDPDDGGGLALAGDR